MQALFIQLSGLVGVVSFLNLIWNNASIERTLFVSVGLGALVYLILTIGGSLIQRILLSIPATAQTEDARVSSETVSER
ncbi:MAG: hypothetical protein SH809_01005 [Rhodothermales bacterium]|nr:hypothetical protein [Rhodothermales bacterium]